MMIGRRYYLSCLSLGLTFVCLRSVVEVADAVRLSSDYKYWKNPRLNMQSRHSVVLQPGETLRLRCEVVGVDVLWYKNKILLRRSKRVTFLNTKRGSTLFIRNVNSADAGIYRCQASNEVGRTSLNSINGISVRVTESSRHAVPCDGPPGYCLNGGTCLMIVELQTKFCA